MSDYLFPNAFKKNQFETIFINEDESKGIIVSLKKCFIIQFREKWYKQNMSIIFRENDFVCDDFQPTVNKTS